MALIVNHLNAYYGDMQALYDISLRIEAGHTVALLGANAAGKSTLINCLSGVVAHKSGEVIFNDEHLENLPPNRIVERGVIQSPEGRRVFPFMTVFENIEMGAYLPGPLSHKKENLEKVFALLPKLKDRSKQLAGSLSGGEQQMLAIGRALMSEPKLLMLDEPTLGLAPIIVDKMFEIIEHIKGLGTTVLLVEQNVQNALEVSDYAYVLGNGHLVTEGSAKDMLNDESLIQAFMGM